MGRSPRELTPGDSALHFFGAELRHWRTVRELSQVALGLRTHDSDALISKVEKGSGSPPASSPGVWLGSLHSARNLERFNAVRRALAAHVNRSSVQEFEDRFRTTVMVPATRA